MAPSVHPHNCLYCYLDGQKRLPLWIHIIICLNPWDYMSGFTWLYGWLHRIMGWTHRSMSQSQDYLPASTWRSGWIYRIIFKNPQDYLYRSTGLPGWIHRITWMDPQDCLGGSTELPEWIHRITWGYLYRSIGSYVCIQMIISMDPVLLYVWLI